MTAEELLWCQKAHDILLERSNHAHCEQEREVAREQMAALEIALLEAMVEL